MTIPNGFGQVNWFWESLDSGHSAETTFGVALSDAPSSAELVTWHSAAMNDIMDIVSSYWTINRIQCQVGGGGPLVEAALSHTGGGNAASETPQVAWLLRKSTGSGGRANRGRMYIPGVPEALADSAGLLIGGAQSDMTAAAAALLTVSGPIAGGVVLHANGDTPTEITSIACDSYCATQRRRQRR